MEQNIQQLLVGQVCKIQNKVAETTTSLSDENAVGEVILSNLRELDKK